MKHHHPNHYAFSSVLHFRDQFGVYMKIKITKYDVSVTSPKKSQVGKAFR
ncbi:hypothetical protein MADA3029_340013 [Vibrio nigripulchritudo MADA3029]|nr:hypothetical protein VIBNIMADA3020_1260013 [Vibrio nigripulchritudo MADA3020]CCN52648.1 hypothetical protein VIBNIMADA3021_130026 [Vibrio nigripulchritudo MADA3021]CCN59069.1 hypothetical protein MADA3029_340013 [Vibrio nigripulchritudo MADA3029]